MVHPNNKKQKVGDNTTTYKEEVLFNTDTLSKIISYLPSVDLLNLALVSKRFGISNIDDGLSLIEKSVHIAVQDIATKEQLATLPYYNGTNSLANYHYLQFMRGPLTFDQLVGAEYVSGDKSCVTNSGQGVDVDDFDWETAFSNNILRAGKHYVTLEVSSSQRDIPVLAGVMRPGQINREMRSNPFCEEFHQNFSPHNNYDDDQCCMYNSFSGELNCWDGHKFCKESWDGMEDMKSFSCGEIGILLDLDEGTLIVYKNRVRLGVIKSGLAGQYCWVVSMWEGTRVTIKRGTLPPS